MGVYRWLPHGSQLCFLLFSLGRILGQRELDTMCRSKPVAEGGTGVVNISLRPQIDLAKDNVFIYLKKENDSVDTLRCARQTLQLPLQCETVQGRGFLTEGLLDHGLSLTAPNVSVDLAGLYVLLVYVNDVPDPPVHCVLTVLRETDSQHLAASGESGSNPVSIVVPVLVLVAIAIAIGVVIFWRRRRKGKHKQERSEEEVPMNTSTRNRVDGTEAADERDITTITPNTTSNTTNDATTTIPTDATTATTTTTTAATINPITTSSPIDTSSTPTASTDATSTTTTTTSTTSSVNTNNAPTTTLTTTNSSTTTTNTTSSIDIDTNGPTTTTAEVSSTSPATVGTNTARETHDNEEGTAPVKVNRLLQSRAAGRTNRPSARDRLPGERMNTHKNTGIGVSLQAAVQKGPAGFNKRGIRHGAARLEEEDMFYTAKMT